MVIRAGWTRQQLLVAFNLYCQLSFGQLDSRTPIIIRYAALIRRTPSALAMKLSNIASLDPAITSTGRRGLAGASAADKAMWLEMESDWDNFAIETERAIGALGVDADVQAAISSEPTLVDENIDYTGSNKQVITTTRVGQNFFRRAVLSAYQYKCCITGLAVPKLLVASHIVPWRDDASNRLNPKNGLCLSMLHDKAFDVGVITITENMTVMVSRKQASADDYFFNSALLAYDGKSIASPEKFAPHQDFLAYHRQHIFSL
ncbi:MAG: HNH endonuclease [Gallionella sp.]|nr:HNH endonuclease [Gallionella sp.]